MNKKLIAFIIVPLTTILGAIFGRMDGGGVIKTPEIVERLLVMSFFIIACIPFAGWWSILAIFGMVGIATGHGQYFLTRMVKPITPEFFDFLVKPIFGRDPREPRLIAAWKEGLTKYSDDKLYWRCVFGMFVTGTMVALPALILAIVFNAWLAVPLFSLIGVVKALSYMLGYKLDSDSGTEIAEWVNGGLRSLVCATVFIIYLGA